MEIAKPDLNNCTDRQFEKWFWSSNNEMCDKCYKTCKQSHVVSLSCSKFENKDKI